MNSFNPDDRFNPRLAIYIAVGLFLEGFFLFMFLAIWMAFRGLPLSAIFLAFADGNKELQSELISGTGTIVYNTQVFSTASPSPAKTASIETSSPVTQAAATWIPPAFPVNPPGKIVYVCFDGSFDQICLMNADGTQKRKLTDEPATHFYPSLSPNGQQIVFSSNRDGNFEIYLLDINSKNIVQLTSDIGNLFAPEISPKGNRIVFTHETGGQQSIWIMKIDGRNARPLIATGGGDIDPTWSPGGNYILFASSYGGVTQLYTVLADGSELRPVFDKPQEVEGRSSWSSDNLWLAFYAGRKGDRNIFVYSLITGDVIQLTHGGDNLGPSFSPDGHWLTFTSYRDGNNEIYIMYLETQAVFRLTSNPLADWQPRWGN